MMSDIQWEYTLEPMINADSPLRLKEVERDTGTKEPIRIPGLSLSQAGKHPALSGFP